MVDPMTCHHASLFIEPRTKFRVIGTHDENRLTLSIDTDGWEPVKLYLCGTAAELRQMGQTLADMFADENATYEEGHSSASNDPARS